MSKLTEKDAWLLMSNELKPGEFVHNPEYGVMLTNPKEDESWIIKTDGLVGDWDSFKKILENTWMKK